MYVPRGASGADGRRPGFPSEGLPSPPRSARSNRGNKIGDHAHAALSARSNASNPPFHAKPAVVPPLGLTPLSRSGDALANPGREDSNPLSSRTEDLQLIRGELKQALQDMLNKHTAQIIDAIQASKQPISARSNETKSFSFDRDQPSSRVRSPRMSPRGEADLPQSKSLVVDPDVPSQRVILTKEGSKSTGNVLGRHVQDSIAGDRHSRLEEAYQYVLDRDYQRLPRAIRAINQCFERWHLLRGRRHNIGNRWFDKLVHNTNFIAFSGLMIVMHTMLAVWETNYLITNYDSTELPREYLYLEIVFAAWYTIEFALRISSNGLYFFLGPEMSWNLFDIGIIFISIFVIVGAETPIKRWAFLRTLRIVRVVKILRIIKLAGVFGLQRLQLMVHCILGSLTTLFWCIVLLAFTAFIFGVYFVQAIALSLNEAQSTLSAAQIDEVEEFFGSVFRASLTLFMAISGGLDWYDIWRIISLADWGAQWIFLLYMVFCMIALLNIITSIFVENALVLAQPDAHSKMVSARREALGKAKKFREVFDEMDLDSSQTISLSEFTAFLKKPEFDHFMHEAGIDIKDAQTFFSMLLDHRVTDDEELDISTLISTCLHIQGQANNLDVQVMRYELKELMRGQRRMMTMIGDSKQAAAAKSPRVQPSDRAQPSSP